MGRDWRFEERGGQGSTDKEEDEGEEEEEEEDLVFADSDYEGEEEEVEEEEEGTTWYLWVQIKMKRRRMTVIAMGCNLWTNTQGRLYKPGTMKRDRKERKIINECRAHHHYLLAFWITVFLYQDLFLTPSFVHILPSPSLSELGNGPTW